MLNRVAWSTAKGVGVNRLGGECSGPKPESYPRTYPNPRIPEDSPGPDPLDPGDHPSGTPGTPTVPPEGPGAVYTQLVPDHCRAAALLASVLSDETRCAVKRHAWRYYIACMLAHAVQAQVRWLAEPMAASG